MLFLEEKMTIKKLTLKGPGKHINHPILKKMYFDVQIELKNDKPQLFWPWSGDKSDWTGGDWSGGDWSGGDWSGGDWSGGDYSGK